MSISILKEEGDSLQRSALLLAVNQALMIWMSLILIGLLLAGCSNSPSEVLRIADSTDISLEFREISDKDTIIQIHKIVDELVWVDEAIETKGNPDYSFWLKRENEELRITNYEV